MERMLFKGGIAAIHPDKGHGFIESIDHPESLWFSFRYLQDPLEVGDTVLYEVTTNHRGQKEAARIRKVYRSSNGAMVIFGMKIQVDPDVKDRVKQSIGKLNIDLSSDYQVMEQTFPGITGKVLCVKINESDKIIYARPWKRNKYWKFVLDRRPEQSNVMTIGMKKDQGIFIILSAHFGPSTPAFPWDPNGEFETSRSFWEHHAMVLDGSIRIDPDSIHGYLPEELKRTMER